jgi:predicted ATP-grasp superfamily ATP-dependent carboligase
MGKVLTLEGKKKGKVVKPIKDMISEALDQDIQKLCVALQCTPEQAIKTASDFYLQYPILVEHVRSTDFMLRK